MTERFQVGETWQQPRRQMFSTWRVVDWIGYPDGRRKVVLQNESTYRQVRRWDDATDGWIKREAGEAR